MDDIRLIADNVRGLLSYVDADGRFRFVNKTYEEWFGLEREEIVGKHCREVLGEAVYERLKPWHERVLAGHRVSFETVLPYRCGADRWVSVTDLPDFDERAEVRGFCSIVTDIDERKRIEQAFQQSEERFNDFAETAADWFWEVGPDLRFRYLAGRHEAVTGLACESVIGRTHEEAYGVHPHDSEAWDRYRQSTQARESLEGFQHRVQRADGDIRMLRESGRPVFDQDRKFQGYRGVGRDVTSAHNVAIPMVHQATHDALTGLVNRRDFERRLEYALLSAREHAAPYTLCFLDLDQFKAVNDAVGHVAGDEVLKQIVNLLLGKIRTRDTLARVGGDEFCLLLENCPLEKAIDIAESLLAALRENKFDWQGRTFEIGVSIGLVPITAESESTTALLHQADAACYTAKDLGRNRLHVYQIGDSELGRRPAEGLRASELREAIDEDRFQLFCQPIVPLKAELADGPHFELLARMLDRDGATVSPATFVPAAERYGLMAAIDRWVIRASFRRFMELDGVSAEAAIAINLSGHSLNDDSLLDYVRGEFADSGIPPNRVCFEITETAAVRDLSRAAHFMRKMGDTGCHFALDDFGSGLSSFMYLKHLPVDYLKIDGSFVRDMAHEFVDRAMVAAINQVGHIMKIRTVAEGVEEESATEQLKELGVDYAQGHAFGAPAPFDAAALRRPDAGVRQ